MSHSGIEPQTPAQQQQRIDVENYSDASSVVDERTDDEKKRPLLIPQRIQDAIYSRLEDSCARSKLAISVTLLIWIQRRTENRLALRRIFMSQKLSARTLKCAPSRRRIEVKDNFHNSGDRALASMSRVNSLIQVKTRRAASETMKHILDAITTAQKFS